MRFVVALLAIVPAVLCQDGLVPEDSPRPAIRGYSTIRGVCNTGSGTISGAQFSGQAGTLKQCAAKCAANDNCKGYNFRTDDQVCQLFSTVCDRTDPANGKENFYIKGEIACSSSTVGNAFVVAFMANRVAKPVNMDLELWVTQDKKQDPIKVILEGDDSTGMHQEVQVGFKKAVKITIPYTWKLSDIDDGKNGGHGVTIEKKALALVSPDGDDFVFYGVNKEFFTADAFMGIPTRSLGTRYFAVCHWPPFYNCEFAFTVALDDTTISVTLPSTFTDNQGNWRPKIPDASPSCQVPYQGKTYTNGDTITFKVSTGEAVQIQAECDLTGSKIVSDKPIAVWSGDSRTNVGDSESRDHQVEQLFSVDTWGTDCAAWPTPNRADGLTDYWVILAAEDNTVITIDSNEKGSTSFTLNAGQSRRFPANSVREWQRFSSAGGKRFQAIQYAHSAKDTSIPGDPSMTICIPSDQFGFGYTFVTPTGVATSYINYLTIITNKANTQGFLLNNNPVTDIQWNEVPNSNLVGGSVLLVNTTQQFRIEHRLKGVSFEAYIYGAGDRESIAYPTGSCIKALGECTESRMVIADGKDNDCDGVIDEELFDGIDNDFDGKVDEDCYDEKPKSKDRCPVVNVAQACYNGQLSLTCSAAGETIKVISAHYGRLSRPGEKTCGSDNVMDSCSGSDVGCSWNDISSVIRLQCDGQTTCTSPVNQYHQPSSCPTCSTYAHVQYVCLNAKEQAAGVLSGQNYQASSWLQTTVLADTCGADKQAKAGDQHHPKQGDHDNTNAVQAWRPAACDKNSSWLLVDLGSQYPVGWYSISGCRRSDYWISKFVISYSLDGVTWTYVNNGQPFDGNSDAFTAKVCTLFQYNIVARYVRIHTVDYNGYPCAHVDFGHSAQYSGCPSTTVQNSNFANGGNAGFGTSATVECNKGWATGRAEKSYNVKCGADGKWASDFRDCNQLLHCPDIPSIDGGYATGPSTLPGATITFRCLQGYTLQGANQATCGQDGKWSAPAPTCRK